MHECQNVVRIEYEGKEHIQGSAFILPTLNAECMFLVTAHHVFGKATEIDTNLITIVGQNKEKLSFEYDSDYFTDESLDICILKIKYSDSYICPIISTPYEQESVYMFGFPMVLSDTKKIYHSLNCSIDEIKDGKLIAKIDDDITNYLNEEHKMIEGFSGCPFVSSNESNDMCFLGIENKSLTEDVSYKLVEGITGMSIVQMIYNHFYKDIPIRISDLFRIQESNERYIIKKQYTYNYSGIERKVIPYKYIQESTVYFHVSESKSLMEYCDDNRLIVLLGDAGCGKSFVLNQLAAQAYSSEYYPLLVPLSDYAGESIEELIQRYYPRYKELSLLLIFDAFDEARQEDRDIFARKINSYVDYRPKDRIIISVRNNFYRFNNSENSQATFDGFLELGLCALDTEDIRAYVRKKNVDYALFEDQIVKNHLQGLVCNPFYLDALTTLMLENGKLPPHDQLMETLISNSITFDSNKYRNPDIINRSKVKLKRLLREIAFSMQLLNDKTVLSTEYYQYLLEEVDDRDLLEHSAIFLAENNEKWKFEHNNFREYLAAQYLAELDFNTIKDILCSDQKHSMIRESWLNVISYLVMLYQKDDLLEWLSILSPELLVKFETSRINMEERTRLFIRIYEIYSEKNMYITRGINQIDELAEFGQSPTSIAFLISRIQESSTIWGKANAILLLKECKEHLYQNEDKIRKELIHCILSDDIYLKSISIGALGKLKLGTKDITEIILQQLKATPTDTDDGGYLCYMIVEYIIDNEIYEEHIDLLLQLTKQATTESNCYSVSIAVALHEIYDKIESESSLKKLMIHFSTEHYTPYRAEEAYNSIVKKAIDYYNTGDESFYEFVTELVLKDKNSSFTSVLKSFFIETNTLKQTINKLLSESSVDNQVIFIRSNFFMLFADSEEMLEAVKNLSDFNLESTRFYINTILLSLKLDSPRYNEYIKCLSNKDFPLPQHAMNYDEQKQAALQKYFDALFSRESFQELIDELLQELGDESLTNEMIREKFSEHFHATFTPQREILLHLIMTLENYSSSGDSLIKNFTNTISNWDDFCIYNLLKELKSSGSIIKINDEQREFVRKYCESLDIGNLIRNGIIESKPLSIQYSFDVVAFCYLSNYFDFKYSQETFQKMTMIPVILFDIDSSENSPFPLYITHHLNPHDLSECVKHNLKDEKLCTLSILGHIRYCTENKLDCAIEAAEKLCFDIDIPSYYKEEALRYLIQIHNDDKEHYQYVYDKFLKTDDEKLLDALIHLTSHAHKKRLREKLEVINSQYPDKTKYLNTLINMQSTYALEVYYTLAEERMTLPDFESGVSSITESIANVNTIDALPWIIKLKDLLFKDGFKDKSIFGLSNSIWKALRNIADNYSEKVLEELRDGLNNPGISDREKSFCNNMISEIESSINCRLDMAWDLPNIKRFLKTHRV